MNLSDYNESYFVNGAFDDYANCEALIRHQAKLIHRLFKPKSVLDIGCAYGFSIDYFIEQRIPALGIEPSSFAVSKAKSPLVLGGMIPFDDENSYHLRPFDLVICTEVLEHIPQEDIRKAMISFLGVTGRYLVLCIALEGNEGINQNKEIPGHINLHDRHWWNYILDGTGLVENIELTQELDADRLSKEMKWSGRWFVRERK